MPRRLFDSYEGDMATRYDIVRLASVGSTQDEARQRLAATRNPTLVVADEQIEGRGRQGRGWTSPDRAMFASFSFVSEWEIADRTLLPLVTAVAVRGAVQTHLGVEIGLRWPNDLMVDGAKVGGILVEMSNDDITVGCGLNLWWKTPMAGARGLVISDPGDTIAFSLAEAWVGEFIASVQAGSSKWPREQYETASVTLGRDVTWGEGAGRAVAIAPDGALVVERDGELIELRAGEVHTLDGNELDGR